MTKEEEKYFRAAEDAASSLPYSHSISSDIQLVPAGAWVTVNILVPASVVPADTSKTMNLAQFVQFILKSAEERGFMVNLAASDASGTSWGTNAKNADAALGLASYASLSTRMATAKRIVDVPNVLPDVAKK